MTDAGRFRWRHVLVCGLLWGSAVMLADSMAQPVSDFAFWDWLSFSCELFVQHSVAGLVWAGGLKLAEEVRRPRLLTPAVFLTAWGSMLLLHALVVRRAVAGGSELNAMVHRLPLGEIGAHLFWDNLFYGGLYALGYLSTRRTLWLQRRLAELRLGRHQAEARFREVRLKAVRGQIQPDMLLEALEALGRAYAQDPGESDRLFDLITAFLRAAMPGLHSGASTLSAELQVVGRYAALREALDRSAPRWRLDVSDVPSDLPFPALRLLPALDRMSRATPLDISVRLTARPGRDGFLLRISTESANALPTIVPAALRARLRQDLGLSTMLAEDADNPVAVELCIRSSPPEPLAA